MTFIDDPDEFAEDMLFGKAELDRASRVEPTDAEQDDAAAPTVHPVPTAVTLTIGATRSDLMIPGTGRFNVVRKHDDHLNPVESFEQVATRLLLKFGGLVPVGGWSKLADGELMGEMTVAVELHPLRCETCVGYGCECHADDEGCGHFGCWGRAPYACEFAKVLAAAEAFDLAIAVGKLRNGDVRGASQYLRDEFRRDDTTTGK